MHSDSVQLVIPVTSRHPNVRQLGRSRGLHRGPGTVLFYRGSDYKGGSLGRGQSDLEAETVVRNMQ